MVDGITEKANHFTEVMAPIMGYRFGRHNVFPKTYTNQIIIKYREYTITIGNLLDTLFGSYDDYSDEYGPMAVIYYEHAGDVKVSYTYNIMPKNIIWENLFKGFKYNDVPIDDEFKDQFRFMTSNILQYGTFVYHYYSKNFLHEFDVEMEHRYSRKANHIMKNRTKYKLYTDSIHDRCGWMESKFYIDQLISKKKFRSIKKELDRDKSGSHSLSIYPCDVLNMTANNMEEMTLFYELCKSDNPIELFTGFYDSIFARYRKKSARSVHES